MGSGFGLVLVVGRVVDASGEGPGPGRAEGVDLGLPGRQGGLQAVQLLPQHVRVFLQRELLGGAGRGCAGVGTDVGGWACGYA